MHASRAREEHTGEEFASEALRRRKIVRGFWGPALLLGVLVSTLALWRGCTSHHNVSQGMVARLAYRSSPALESRISEMEYAPATNTRGASDERVDEGAMDQAEGNLLDAVFEKPSPATHHALGRFYLAKRSYPNALAQIAESLEAEPRNAKRQSDYGAVLLEIGNVEQSRGEFGRGLGSLARSLEHLDLAIELDPSLLEARFNRSLCLQRMEVPRQAADAWQSYLEKDGQSNWADEARRNLSLLSARSQILPRSAEESFQEFMKAYHSRDDEHAWTILRGSRSFTGGLVENKLIDDYLEHAVAGRNALARRSFAALSYAGELEYRKTGDRLMPDLIRTYEYATQAQRQTILRARVLLTDAHQKYLKNDFSAALEAYSEARGAFDAGRAECEKARATFHVANCYVQQSKAPNGILLLGPLADVCERKGYKRLLAQTLGGLSNANQYLSDFSTAIENSSRSVSLYEEIGDRIAALKARHLLADVYRFVHDYRQALDLHALDLSLVREYASQPKESWRHYASISLTLNQLDLYPAAIVFQEEALRQATQAGDARLISRTHSFLGSIRAAHGEYAEAENDIRVAIEVGESITEKRVRVEAIAYSLLKLGLIHRTIGAFEKAIEDYDRALKSYGELDSRFFEYTARKERLLCCLEHAACPSFEQELLAVLNLYEQYRGKILDESIRNTFFDNEQTVYDVAIEFAYKSGDQRKAFEYSEKSRGRSLLDLMSNGVKVGGRDNPDVRASKVSQPIGIEEIRSLLPEESQILQYSILPNSIIFWVVKKDGLSTESRSVSIKDLNKRVSQFIRLASTSSEFDSEEFSREAADLYELLIKPVESLLDSGKQLCIVPDKILNYLPFAALMSGASREYFIETHRFVLSPSASVFVLCSVAAHEKESNKAERLLSVGNPLLDKERFPKLANLTSAERETEEIARCYLGSPPPLIGPSATKRRVMDEMEKSEVIHIATHAIIDQWYPLRSKLLLARETSAGYWKESEGVLHAYEIYKLNLQQARLVVLSACQTGIETYYGGEGMIGLSRPFIAKRIPLVVASLWPVDSDSTARLMISFHRFRKPSGLSTAEALRQAQLEMLRAADGNDRLPYNWASFTVIGGFANF